MRLSDLRVLFCDQAEALRWPGGPLGGAWAIAELRVEPGMAVEWRIRVDGAWPLWDGRSGELRIGLVSCRQP